MVKDPELKSTPSGVNYVNFTLAVERSYVAKGEERETDFIDFKAWRGTAEFINNYFPKGSWIGVTGELQTYSYTTDDGNKRKMYYINVRDASFAGSAQKSSNQAQAQPQAPAPAFPAEKAEQEFIRDDDIPF